MKDISLSDENRSRANLYKIYQKEFNCLHRVFQPNMSPLEHPNTSNETNS